MSQCKKKFCSIQLSDKLAAQQPTTIGKAEMKAAQTALLICLWEDGFYEEGSQV